MIYTHANGDIIHRDTGVWADEGQAELVDMYWQDKVFRMAEGVGDTATGTITYIMSSDGWDGEVQVCLHRSATHPDMWCVRLITTFVPSAAFPGGKPKQYVGGYIQVLHKRI